MAFEGMHPTFRQVPPREPRLLDARRLRRKKGKVLEEAANAKAAYSPSDRAGQP
jgi:hypothetical protein